MKIFLIFLISFLFLFLTIDFLQKKVFRHVQWSRKATHILSGVLIFPMPMYLGKTQIIWLAVIFSVILAISKWRNILSLHNVYRKTLGEVFYPLSILFLALICLPQYPVAFQSGVLVLAFSDGLTGIVGELWNFRPVKLFNNTKSIGGAIVFFAVTIIIFVGFHGFSIANFYLIIGAAFILTVVEFFLVYGFDNLALPILTAVIELFVFN